LDFNLGEDAEELRSRLRSLIAEEIPEDFHGAFGTEPETRAISDRFCRRLGDEGLLTINWPREYGGSGRDLWSQAVVREEMWAHHEPRGPQYMGLNWVGPVIMRYGTEAQKEQLLPEIAAGDARWCQGFSEPGAGSDLGSLRLPATRQDDGTWNITGQKIWTSYVMVADYCFLTTRTSNGPRKHAGITIFLVPMSRPGVTVRPIEAIMGEGHLHEVFFDNFVAYDSDILGEVGQGWEIIRAVLDLERIGIARYARSDRLLHDLWEYAGESCEEPDDELQLRHARALARTRVARLLAYRFVSMMESNVVTSGDAAVARLGSTLLDPDVAELAMEMLGSQNVSASLDAPLGGFVEDAWRYSRSAGIASGTTEINRMLVARDVLAAQGRER
jgi:alkylation response protein AidB-like acyl-CoA dehydrogenase